MKIILTGFLCLMAMNTFAINTFLIEEGGLRVDRLNGLSIESYIQKRALNNDPVLTPIFKRILATYDCLENSIKTSVKLKKKIKPNGYVNSSYKKYILKGICKGTPDGDDIIVEVRGLVSISKGWFTINNINLD